MLEYRIVEKAQFTIMGKARTFDMDTSYEEIPWFWQEHLKYVLFLASLQVDPITEKF